MPSTATSILDGLSTSVAVKAPCRTVATTNITLSGLQTISGYTTVENDRVLVKGQTDPVENGIYMASTGSWTRSKDADGARDLVQGTIVRVRSTTISGVEYELTTANPIVIGTTALTFELRYGANATYDQTESEITAGVTPSNEAIPSHDALGYVVPQRYGVTGDGTTNDYAAMVNANAVAAAAGAALVLGNGTYVLNTSLAFSVPVVMEGGVIRGTGTVSFPSGFSAPPYYCFDCLVGQIKAEVVHAEWFGARQSTATPTSTSVDISAKAWNTWPSWVTGATFGTDPGHDYGDTAFLAANIPFSNGDTWDMIAVQRALWSIGEVTTRRGEVRMFGGTYYFNKPIRYTGNMASTLSGAGNTKTLIDSPDWALQGTVGVDVGTARALIHCYRIGPDPTIIEGIGLTGPSGYVYGGSPPIYLATHIGSNGVIHRNQWLTTADAGWYFGSSCSDCTIEDFHCEYLRRAAYGYDSLSWVTIRNGGFWESGAGAQAVDFLRYVFMKSCELIGYTLEPIVCGEGSHLSGITLIQDGTDYKTHIDGRVITRRVQCPAGGSVTVLTVKMGDDTAVRTRMVAGGVVQGLGSAGLERTIVWYREATNPVAAGSAATEWGNASAIATIAESVSTDATTFSLTLTSSGSGSQDWDAYVTIFIEGSDCVIQGLT